MTRRGLCELLGVINIFNEEAYINTGGLICSDSIIQYQVKKLERGNIISLNVIVLQRIFPIDSVINVIINTWKSPSIIDKVCKYPKLSTKQT